LILVSLATALRPLAAQAHPDLADQVRAAETAFAGSMAQRDFTAFGRSIAEEAIFFGRAGPLRGKAAIQEVWRDFFTEQKAPFSWAPEIVEVLPSGKLALSSGPVLDEAGKRIGTFNSIWRLDPDGRWRVIFDKGCPGCPCAAPPAPADSASH
jgi:ketosteroid isomerase-like protein